MSLVADDLLAPKGRIEGKAMFPDLSTTDLAARMEEYLTQGYARADTDLISGPALDKAVRWFVYWRAFESVYLSFLSNPLSSTTTEGGSASFAIDQAERFRELAAEALEEYTYLIPKTDRLVTARPQTIAVKNQFNW